MDLGSNAILDILSNTDFPVAYVAIVVAGWLAFFALVATRPVSESPQQRLSDVEIAEASGPISPAGLAIMKAYKYKSSEYTPIDLVMNHWWIWVANHVPAWVAPNLITLTGLMCLATPVVAGLYLSPDLSAVRPVWYYFLVSASLFAYQTLDAVDGKHARATGASSPLGQLFDHGCDAFSVSFVALMCAMALRVTPTGLLLILIATQFPFFVAQWGERHTHTLRTSVGGIGLTETQFFAMTLPLVTAFAPNFWTTPLATAATTSAMWAPLAAAVSRAVSAVCSFPLLSRFIGSGDFVSMHHFVLVAYLATAFLASMGAIISAIALISRRAAAKAAKAEKAATASSVTVQHDAIVETSDAGHSTTGQHQTTTEASVEEETLEPASSAHVLTALAELLSPIVLLALATAWAMAPGTAAADAPLARPLLATAILGGYFTRLTCEMIVAAMTRDEFPILHAALVPFAAYVVSLYVPEAAAPALAAPAGRATALAVAGAGALLAVAPWVLSAVTQISRYLGIYALAQGRRPGHVLKKD